MQTFRMEPHRRFWENKKNPTKQNQTYFTNLLIHLKENWDKPRGCEFLNMKPHEHELIAPQIWGILLQNAWKIWCWHSKGSRACLLLLKVTQPFFTLWASKNNPAEVRMCL